MWPRKDTLPLVQALDPALTSERVFERLSHLPNCLFLDSSMWHPRLGRYSFIAADPCELYNGPQLAAVAASTSCHHRSDLPPFQGGWAGVFTYELAHQFEKLPWAHSEFPFPALAMANYDTVIAFDHLRKSSWIVSQGFPEIKLDDRRRRAEHRLMHFKNLLECTTSSDPLELATRTDVVQFAEHALHPVRNGLYSNFSPRGYEDAVAHVIDYIRAGDVFQVNLSQRLFHRCNRHPVELYLKLRASTSAPFGAYFDAGSFQVLSASPERFLSVSSGHAEARPIKGTRPLTGDDDADGRAANELLNNPKDRAENIMIVDLLRNDLSKACSVDSVHVSQLCELESYGYVQHLVSTVEGELAPGRDALDLLRGAFPGGSVTGAPKVRAMEIITELERVARGPYCGALGYISASGEMDTSILIRTATLAGGWLQMPVGGAVVADSDPAAEHAETWAKATPFLRIL